MQTLVTARTASGDTSTLSLHLLMSSLVLSTWHFQATFWGLHWNWNKLFLCACSGWSSGRAPEPFCSHIQLGRSKSLKKFGVGQPVSLRQGFLEALYFFYGGRDWTSVIIQWLCFLMFTHWQNGNTRTSLRKHNNQKTLQGCFPLKLQAMPFKGVCSAGTCCNTACPGEG